LLFSQSVSIFLHSRSSFTIPSFSHSETLLYNNSLFGHNISGPQETLRPRMAENSRDVRWLSLSHESGLTSPHPRSRLATPCLGTPPFAGYYRGALPLLSYTLAPKYPSSRNTFTKLSCPTFPVSGVRPCLSEKAGATLPCPRSHFFRACNCHILYPILMAFLHQYYVRSFQYFPICHSVIPMIMM